MDLASNNPGPVWQDRKMHLVSQPFAVAVSQSAIPTVLADSTRDDFPVVFANASFLRMTGWDEDEVLGRGLRLLGGDGIDPEPVTRLRQAIADKTEISTEIVLDRKQGPGVWTQLDAAPLFDASGRPTMVFVTLVDISDRLEAARGQRAAEARFEERVEARTAAL